MPMTLFDMHCHLDFFDNARSAAAKADEQDLKCFSVTVTPRDFGRAFELLGSHPNIRVGLGLHPWWVADGSCGWEDIALFEQIASGSSFIGEVGLDFGKRCKGSEAVQLAAFERVLATCGHGGKVVSVHAVRAEDAMLDMLERFGTARANACIMHWFSGSSDQLQRAIGLGCFFSVGPKMAASKRGREYVKAIPEDRLLLETDAPAGPGAPASSFDLAGLLSDTLDEIERLRGLDAAARIEQTSERLFSGF